MAGSITIKRRCLVDGNLAYTGTKEEIVHQLCKIRFDKHNTLYYKRPFMKEVKIHSYSSEWSQAKRYRDAINVVYNKLLSSYDEYTMI